MKTKSRAARNLPPVAAEMAMVALRYHVGRAGSNVVNPEGYIRREIVRNAVERAAGRYAVEFGGHKKRKAFHHLVTVAAGILLNERRNHENR